MELMLLRVFQGQVEQQCQAVIAAATDLDEAVLGLKLTRGQDEEAMSLAWIAIQNLLTGAANISKALWGQKGKNLAPQRTPLRESLQVDDTSPLKPVVVRNHFEHFDEKLDDWWRDSPAHNYIDRGIGPPDMIVTEPHYDVDIFRRYDPSTGDLTFWSQQFNLKKVVGEVQRILPIASAEAAKPHWEPPSSEGSGQPQRPS